MNKTTQPARPGSVLPDEQFWKRYSPHHEFGLSSAGSVAIHVMTIVGVLLVGYVLARLGWGKDDKPINVTGVYVDDSPRGGGGNPDGSGSAPGGPLANAPPVVPTVDSPEVETPAKPLTTTPQAKINPVRPEDLKVEVTDDPGAKRLIAEGDQAVAAVTGITQGMRARLTPPSSAPGKGLGGDGSGGGKGNGIGTGTGDGVGSGDLSVREKRVKRWHLNFLTENGNHYVMQLAALGATLAIPDPANSDGFLVIRKLNQRPVVPTAEDISGIRELRWRDEDKRSVGTLSQALGIRPTPEYFEVFFPFSMEEKLLRLELAFRGKEERDITETRFEIRKVAGVFEPVVLFQR